MITKKFGVHFKSEGGALTLNVSEVSKRNARRGVHSRIHDDGWRITGEIHEDFYTWVSEFHAEHPDLGKVWGNFEKAVYADSELAFHHFYNNHPPKAWDRKDI